MAEIQKGPPWHLKLGNHRATYTGCGRDPRTLKKPRLKMAATTLLDASEKGEKICVKCLRYAKYLSGKASPRTPAEDPPEKFYAFVSTGDDDAELTQFDTQQEALDQLRGWISNAEEAAADGCTPEFKLFRGVEIPLDIKIEKVKIEITVRKP